MNNPLYSFPLSPESVAQEHSNGTLVSTLKAIYKDLALTFHPDRNKGRSYKNSCTSPNSLLIQINRSIQEIEAADKKQMGAWIAEYSSSSYDEELNELLGGAAARIEELENENESLKSERDKLRTSLNDKLRSSNPNSAPRERAQTKVVSDPYDRARIRELEDQVSCLQRQINKLEARDDKETRLERRMRIDTYLRYSGKACQEYIEYGPFGRRLILINGKWEEY